MKYKYAICPGLVTSKTDGQRHYITPKQLMALYGVKSIDCEIYEPQDWWPSSFYRMAEERQQGMIILSPRYDGNYKLPETQA
jgi:hypothetical protein